MARISSSGLPGGGAVGNVLQRTATFAAWAAPTPVALTASYVSADQTITSAGLLTLAHGLGGKPKLIELRLKCAVAEAAYAVGDEVPVTISIDSVGARNHLPVIASDATNVVIRFSDHANVFQVINKSSGISAAITPVNWRLIVRAWA